MTQQNVRTADIKYLLSFSGCVCRSVQGDRSPPLPDSGAERERAGRAEEAVWGQSRARAPDPGSALLHLCAVPLASGVLCLQVAQQLVPAEICGPAAARTRCVCCLDCSQSWSRVPSTLCSWVWESCGGICVRGVFLLCYKKLLIWCGDQWNLVFTGECPVFLALSLGSKSWLQEWLLLPELEMTLITVQKHRVDRTPKFPIFCCPRQYLISSFPNSKMSWIYFLLYFFLEGHLKS